MREIKFRCWFPKGTDTGDGEIEKGEMCYDLAFEEYEPINNLLHSVEFLMQFTGLKDKNKKEIYEGDIVAVGERKDLTQCAYDKFGIPCLLGIKYPEAHNFMELEQKGLNKYYEVIGNVFENPELMK